MTSIYYTPRELNQSELKLFNELKEIEDGVCFTSTSKPLKNRGIIVYNTDKLGQSPLSFRDLTRLENKKLISRSNYKDVTYVHLTYDGRSMFLDLQGFDHDKFLKFWKERISLCCDKAIPSFCVCRLKTMCSDHGSICRGSHD